MCEILIAVLFKGFLIVFNEGGKKKKQNKTKLASLCLHVDTALTACVHEALQI